jgi:hypothetical protein
VAGTRQVGRRGIARLLMVCAVLAGLFLMHGAPATAAEGCHGVMSAPTAMDNGPAAAPMASAAHGTMAHSGSEQAGAPTTVHGAMCVSTPARERTPLPVNTLTAVVAVMAAAVLAGRAVVQGRPGRRGPPPAGGRSLLLQVGIART